MAVKRVFYGVVVLTADRWFAFKRAADVSRFGERRTGPEGLEAVLSFAPFMPSPWRS